MTDPIRLPTTLDRRRRSRRVVDRIADEETRLLAMTLDVLAADAPAEARLADLLDLLAETVGASRAAVVADGEPRRVAVSASGPDDAAAAMELATWLDAAAPRSRAQRAASGPAAIEIATRSGSPPPGGRASKGAGSQYAWVPVPAASKVALGFAFARPMDADGLPDRLPPALARHAAVALALVTESMATERELATLRARETERARYVSTVAHELRTPLTGLSGYLDLILGGHVDDELVEREFLERGRSIVDSMTALVGDLLELSRLESGSLVLDTAPFSVADALHTVSAALLPIALDRDVPLITTPPTRIRTANGDRRRVEQIVTNLAANALKFGSAGSEVELTGRFDGQVAIIAVRDEGPGIGADDRGRIFDRFYRMADHERVTGTGLGLSISRELARAMGGDLDVASRLGTGSTFVLVLPGPSGPLDPEVIANATAAAVQDETDRLDALAAIRAAGSTRTSTGRTLEARSRGVVPAGSKG
ncbi:MAG TPA: HAMP domain-containing sensor histidine kinase [Candidatus Limnocylindrales bacterium]|jgi:signal transduction histidine kinase|nr:HAMP domain-containing sensor histidine kinase [Candidatus Limnocylindrales bacterium]